MTTTITITGRTSGSGKTSVAVNLAATLAEHYQKRVLLIDLGQNEALLDQFGYSYKDFRYSLQDLITRNAQDFQNHIIRHSEHLHLLSGRAPSERDVLRQIRAVIAIITAPAESYGGPDWTWDDKLAHYIPYEERTRAWLRNLLQTLSSEYDFVLFDGASISEILSWCACSLSQIILIPNGLNLREIREMELTIAVIFMLILVYQMRPHQQKQKILRHATQRSANYEDARYQEAAGRLFLDTQIEASQFLSKTRKEPVKLPVLAHPNSTLAQDYKALVKELETLITQLNNSAEATSC